MIVNTSNIKCQQIFINHLIDNGNLKSIFNNNHSITFRHDDLKQMLDSNKDGLKLEAMKRIIGV